jgi:hypothetical protein
VIAAEVTVDSPDFGHLQPMLDAAQSELQAAGVTETPGVLLADAGYWNKEQMENVINHGIQVLIPPDAGHREGTRPGWEGGATHTCDECSPPSLDTRFTENARR